MEDSIFKSIFKSLIPTLIGMVVFLILYFTGLLSENAVTFLIMAMFMTIILLMARIKLFDIRIDAHYKYIKELDKSHFRMWESITKRLDISNARLDLHHDHITKLYDLFTDDQVNKLNNIVNGNKPNKKDNDKDINPYDLLSGDE